MVTATSGAGNVESAELIAMLREVRDRVRARHPQTSAGGRRHAAARPDAAGARARRGAGQGGRHRHRESAARAALVNSLVQAWKRMVARVLDWHVREQVEFNRKAVACIDAALEAMNDTNRAHCASSAGPDRGWPARS